MIKPVGYQDSLRFLSEHNGITYPEFDYDSVHSLNLFSSFEDIDLTEIDKEVENMEKVLPSMKRIFAKPIIHLIDEDEIVSVEAVRYINNRTISYASAHSELWDDVTEDGIKPLKLLTNSYRDNYAIYENVVFVRAVDYALNFCKHYSRILKNMIYTNKKLEIDLLERENHFSYYLALGKLETGHIRSFSTYIDMALNLIDRMDFIYKVLSSRVRRPVYVACHKVKGKIKLRKTNILSMQKEYRSIYRFMKGVYKEEIDEMDDTQEEAYLYFCKYLLLFAVGHFNFTMEKEAKIDFRALNLSFNFKEYHLSILDIETKGRKGIELTFQNDKEYKIILIPSLSEFKIEKSEIETHILSDDYDTKDTFVSINNIDSFRRIQQLLLKGMIYSTTDFKTCPFCGGELDREKDSYHCHTCRQVIGLKHCDGCHKDFYYTSIYQYQVKKEEKLSPLMNRNGEGKLHYRNITDMTDDLEPICENCRKLI